jgi:serpin B
MMLSGTALAQPADHATDVAAAQAKFTGGLIGRLAKNQGQQTGNIVVAPAGAAAVFSILSAGADRPMQNAMLDALGFKGQDPEAAKKTFASLREAFKSLVGTDSPVRSANRIVLDPSLQPYDFVLDALKAAQTDIVRDDLSKPEGITALNDWVKDKTGGMIPKVLEQPINKPALVAVNALYFKAPWQMPFNTAESKQGEFQNPSKKAVPAMMMHLAESKYAFRQDKDFVGIDLPFKQDRFSFTIVTTASKVAKPADLLAAASWLDGKGFETRPGDLTMPRLSLSADTELLPALDALGLAKARTTPTALGGFAPGTSLSQVTQKVEFRATEEGAEGAAATTAVATRDFSGKPIHLVVDRPFLFAVRDHQSGLILFAGYVAQPGSPDGKTDSN